MEKEKVEIRDAQACEPTCGLAKAGSTLISWAEGTRTGDTYALNDLFV